MTDLIKVDTNYSGDLSVYRLIKGWQKIHEDYGLWICFGNTDNPSQVHQKPIPRYFEFYNISHLIKGHGWFWTPEEGAKTFEAGQAVMLIPGMVHDYSGFDCYEEEFICFTGPIADHLFKSGIIKPGIVNIGNLRVLLPIIEMASLPDRNSQIKANIALQELIVKIYFENHTGFLNPEDDRIGKLLHEFISHPEKWWTVTEMAEIANLSLNQFINKFTDHTGLTPKKYIDAFKIRMAAEMLHSSRETLASVAKKLGYRDPFHLSRRFKEITGVSPADYRRGKKTSDYKVAPQDNII
jgi:AraC-like DNA-binding protein